MNGLIWNCRGLNNALAPTIPKIRALTSSSYYDFLFLIETKCNVNNVSPLFRPFGFVKSAGIDANGAAGGLWVGWKKEAKMSLIEACNNFLVLLVEKMNGRLWYLVLFYGAPNFELRESVFENLETYLQKLSHPYLIVGDFNQVDYRSDKLSARNSHIRGACSFNKWKLRNEFIDIPFKGPRFTWCKNRKGDSRVYERLDKALGSKEWFTLFPETECIQVIKDVWTVSDNGSPAFRVTRKLARVKQRCRKWALDKRNDWSDKWDDFDKRLERGIEIATAGGGEEEYELVNEEVREFTRVMAIYWKQRAKLKWLVDGDTCTKYFFNWVKGRAGRNYILGIKRNDGNWTYDHEEISDCFQKSFTNLFSRPCQAQQPHGHSHSPLTQLIGNIQNRVTNDDADFLGKPYTAKEVRQAVFQMGPMKSPGPDGIPAVFYLRCWHLVKRDCTKAILSILNSGAVLKEMNRTVIALIPKCDSPEEVKDYRPISLCNVIMRIITKCITNRMQRVMGYLVGDYQNAFLAGRNISDNILLAHEAIHKVNSHKHGKSGRVAFKADMSKAFDRVRWDFLQAVLLAFGFPSRMVSLIMNCVSTVSYEILLNGVPLRPFKPQCGLRQGDPVSPYLFILCMEVLSCNVECAQREGIIQGIRLCRGVPPLTHLFFADDSVFFIQIKGAAVRHLKRLLVNYWETSGQVINDDKSGLIFSPNTTLRQVRSCLKSLNIKHNKGFGKYLGLPTEFQESKKVVFMGLIEAVMKRISSWNGIFLSPAGRLTLISSVLSNLSIFFLSAFKIPPGIDSNLNVWDKKWVNGQTPEPKDCLLDGSFIFLKDLRVKDICVNNGGWNEGLIKLLFTEDSANQILAIPLCASQSRDEIFSPKTSGTYTVKSGYGISFQDYFNEHGSKKDKERLHANWELFCRKRLWNLPGPQPWKILLWKIMTSSLPVGSEFAKRDLNWAPSCSMCNNAGDTVETLDHLFRDCPLSSRIWAGSELGINVSHLPTLDVRDWIINWVLYLSGLEEGVTLVLSFLAILVSLWSLRNNIRFRGEVFNPNVFFIKARQLIKEVLQANDRSNNAPLHPLWF
ncbi:uncharacterized protein LOC141632098 [Silene latifolia]|uniref:uncharacterized protein LOC141632098 n=1 Tax=Silene latifolia TaxID=37657 RepID=UPI003D76CB2C